MDDLDVLIGRWHNLADLVTGSSEDHLSDANEALVTEIRLKCLADKEIDKFESSKEFTEYVTELHRNEKAWSRRLGEVILLAQDLADSGDKKGAARTFDKFEASCPWMNFVDISQNQKHAMELA